MAKSDTRYRCPECGYESANWFARCPDTRNCGEFVDPIEVLPGAQRKGRSETDRPAAVLAPLSNVTAQELQRIPTGIGELDRVLGGGAVPGSFILLAGEPGAGKSTMSGEMCLNASHVGQRVAYFSGEESSQQVKSRMDRLAAKIDGCDPGKVEFSKETGIERICQVINAGEHKLVVVDSIQTVLSEEISGAPGGVSQVRECAHQLMVAAKASGTIVVAVGQFLKSGDMAGPKTLEHLVDVVLMFESTRDDDSGGYRILRSQKNRFGSVDEVGVFEMQASGLKEIPNPSEVFAPRRDKPIPGTVTCAVLEGSRPVLVEVQALTNVNDRSPMPTRVINGVDPKRVQMLTAVMSRKLGFALGSMDVFVNIQGGLKVTETAADLAVCVALASAVQGRPVKDGVCVYGEVNLVGEVARASQAERRTKEAQRLGYTPLPYQPTLRAMLDAALSDVTYEEGLDGKLAAVAA